MGAIINISRRDFCKSSAVLSGGLVLAFYAPGYGSRVAEALAAEEFIPNAFIRIAPDETITVIVNKSEMGQGVYTSLPMLVGEELEADWSTIRFAPAPVDDAYNHTQWGPMQGTGGSTSIRSCWGQFREAGASARIMLERAAAETWKADPADCKAEKGFVINKKTGRKISFGTLADQAAKQPVPENVELKPAADFEIIGTSKKRLDTPEKVNGRAVFGIDVNLPGMLTAVIARPPVFGATVKSFDDTKAKMIPGVKHVVQIDRGIAVVADHFWPAKKGRDALQIEWDEGPHASFNSDDQGREYLAIAETPGVVAVNRGDVKKGLAEATKRLDAVYEFPYLAHATMEPLNCVADVRTDFCEIWVGTQMQTLDRNAAVVLTGLPKEKVKLHTTYLGGGFGRRAVGDSHFVKEAVQVSMAVKAPVKVVWTREDDLKGGYYRPRSYHRLNCGLDRNGMPLALNHRMVNQSIVKGTAFEGLIKDGIDHTSVEGAFDTPYEIPNLFVDSHMAPADVPVLWWRSVGHSATAFIKECFIDELAALAGREPYGYRRALLNKHPRQQALLDLVTKKAGWDKPVVAGRGRGIAIHESFGSFVAQVAEVSVADSGRIKVHKVVCAVDCGKTVNPDTIRAQMQGAIIFGLTAALYGKVTFKEGRVEQGNFDDYQMLRINETPEIEVHIMESDEAVGGIGEPGVPPVAPAVANAVFAAKGIRLHQLPMTPELVRNALKVV
ncbi:MAG: xanthine dehydrogenase family protein molybdopterin-binding subunit [Proteobacteria bacterium]|nr:xanthine dehydrogenase family protein molybdopterin-binding subunit [Pseudomonadota bacterium]MBU1738906.1 xanthine dehydrogenase family protein molybdopterin-binding subunit [Pseudomonadota bacterium]